MDKIKELGTKSIGKLLLQYSIPAVIAMVVNAIYNVVDRIFVGQYVGEEALAGLTVAFPIMLMTFAFVSLIGAGGAALLSIRLGEKDIKRANHIFGNTISFGIIITALILIVMFINLDGLLLFFGATPEILEYASTYMVIIFGGYIFQMLAFVLSGMVRTEGKPALSMVSMLVSAISNIVLDFVFIGLMGMGVAGAALATIIGQFIGLVILSSFYLRGDSQLKLTVSDFIPDIKMIGQIVSIGFATFISIIGISVSMTFMNRALGEYGGIEAITSMGAINSLFAFFIMPINGINQGMQPIIGYNHGAKKVKRVLRTMAYGVGAGIVFSTLVFLAMEIYPKTFIGLFLDSESATIDVAVTGLRIFMIMLPLLSINVLGISYFQSTAKGVTAMIIGMLRQFILFLPLLLVLPGLFGLMGVWMAVPISDGIAILITGIVLVVDMRKDFKSYNNNEGENENFDEDVLVMEASN
jgi:putative MATE family efflux protein